MKPLKHYLLNLTLAGTMLATQARPMMAQTPVNGGDGDAGQAPSGQHVNMDAPSSLYPSPPGTVWNDFVDIKGDTLTVKPDSVTAEMSITLDRATDATWFTINHTDPKTEQQIIYNLPIYQNIDTVDMMEAGAIAKNASAINIPNVRTSGNAENPGGFASAYYDDVEMLKSGVINVTLGRNGSAEFNGRFDDGSDPEKYATAKVTIEGEGTQVWDKSRAAIELEREPGAGPTILHVEPGIANNLPDRQATYDFGKNEYSTSCLATTGSDGEIAVVAPNGQPLLTYQDGDILGVLGSMMNWETQKLEHVYFNANVTGPLSPAEIEYIFTGTTQEAQRRDLEKATEQQFGGDYNCQLGQATKCWQEVESTPEQPGTPAPKNATQDEELRREHLDQRSVGGIGH